VFKEAVTRKFRVTASDGKTYDTKHFNLKACLNYLKRKFLQMQEVSQSK